MSTITKRPDGSVVVTRDDGGDTWVPAWAYQAIYELGYEEARAKFTPVPVDEAAVAVPVPSTRKGSRAND